MTLPTSGTITMSDVDVEIGRAPDALIYLGEAEVRDLADVPSGQIFMSNLYGKKFEYPVYGPGVYSFTVPTNVFTLNIVKLVAGGGGGSGTNGQGDIWGGGGGGSGGYYTNQTLSVTPGEVLEFTIGYGGESGRVTFNGQLLCSGTSGSTAGTNGGITKIVRTSNGAVLLQATGGTAGTPAPNGDGGPGAPGAGGSPNGVSGSYQSPIQRNGFAGGPGGDNGTGYGNGGAGNGMSPFTCATKGNNGYLSINWIPGPTAYTGIQSSAGCYSAQGGFSIDYYNGQTTLTMGVWPTDPPNCQTCDWHWLQAGGRGSNGASNDSTSNIYRANNNIRPYWTKVWTLDVGAMTIGQTVYTQCPSWPYTLVSYTYAVTKTGPYNVSIVPYPNSWGTGDTGTSISVSNWWNNVNAISPINLSWSAAPSGSVIYDVGASGSFTVPSNVYVLNVSMVGYGGNGGGNGDWGSGGGGAGGYYRNYAYPVSPGQTISYSVGSQGNNTVFGTLTCTSGGNAPVSANDVSGGAGGSPNGLVGENGNKSNNTFPAIAGDGANSVFGAGGTGGVGGGPSVTGSPGGPATGYGAGGGGGGNNQSGGAGSPARIWISW